MLFLVEYHEESVNCFQSFLPVRPVHSEVKLLKCLRNGGNTTICLASVESRRMHYLFLNL